MLDTSKSAMQYQYKLNKQLADQNRNWQERMANTAHQREIKDLKAAGLNPVLSVTGGNGATTPSGSTASVSDGAGYFSALANLEAAQLNSATQLAIHETPGGNTLYGQLKYLARDLGVDVAEAMESIGFSLSNSIHDKNTAGDFGIKGKMRGLTSYAFDSIRLSKASLRTSIATARLDGNERKAKRLQKKLDRLNYYYPKVK